MDNPSRLRRKALQRIAVLSAGDSQSSDFTKLHDAFPSRHKSVDPSLSQSPISTSEIDILLALCDAAPLVQDLERAERLLTQLCPYLIEAHTQALTPSPYLRTIEPSPWETLTYKVTCALLAIGIKQPALHETAFDCMLEYLSKCLKLVNSLSTDIPNAQEVAHDVGHEVSFDAATTTVSLLGFLDAVSSFTQFFTTHQSLELAKLVRQILDENFMVLVEGVFSSIRTSESTTQPLAEWQSYARRYAASGRPLGAMLLQRGFMRLLVSCTSLQIATAEQLQRSDILDILTSDEVHVLHQSTETSMALLELVCEVSTESMRLLEDGSDYLQLGSAWQQRLGFDVKAQTLRAFLICMTVDEEIADIDILMSWLEDTMAEPVEMMDEALAYIVLRSMAIVAKCSPSTASTLSRSLPRFLVQGAIKGDTVAVAAQTLTYILQLLSQDAMITGLYSLGNMLSPQSGTDKALNGSKPLVNGSTAPFKATPPYSEQSVGSTISLELASDEENSVKYGNIVRAIVDMANSCHDDKITALAQSMLVQKLGRMSPAVDLHILREAAKLALAGGPTEFKTLLKLYVRIGHDAVVGGNETFIQSVKDARLSIAKLGHESQLYSVYMTHLLETIISQGDIHESDNSHEADVDLAARQIVNLLSPLAALVQAGTNEVGRSTDGDLLRLQREAWFNIVVHGIVPGSSYGQDCAHDLRILAMHSRPLIAEDRADQFESEIELNTVLRRGMNPLHVTQQKKRLISLLPNCEADIRGLSYPKVIFLNAAYLVETSRAQTGDCSHILAYFRDPSLNGSAMENCMSAIASEVMLVYIKFTLNDASTSHSTISIAEQLASMFVGCCNRTVRVQQIATSCADRIIHHMPSALCQKSSLFALLELLTIMWTSCLDAELDEYEMKTNYTSTRVSVELSDDYTLRKSTLDNLYRRARNWVIAVINIAPLDVKGLLQTYLSEYNDDGAYGHVSLGRSFALDMGSVIPSSDHKLGAIETRGDYGVNTASDFIAQYTTRQQYRHADTMPVHRKNSVDPQLDVEQRQSANNISLSVDDDISILFQLERRILDQHVVPIAELQYGLRSAAALLCRGGERYCTILQQLVRIPFAVFTKQSIKLGISLWLGIFNENPHMEPRILTLVAEEWEKTVNEEMGAFSKKLSYPDPFYTKEEFAPSEKQELVRKQETIHDLIAPHLRLIRFLTSHFNASLLGKSSSLRTFQRLAMVTLRALKHTSGHPLAREFHFQAVLLGLNVLRHFTSIDHATRWRLKDIILSAALAWFSHPPKWSYGGNRLQIKGEVRLLNEVESSLRAIESLYAKDFETLKSLAPKQSLLHFLLENERTRLIVWLFPLDHERRHLFTTTDTNKIPSDATLASFLQVAWTEGSALATQITNRIASQSFSSSVRSLLLKNPESALESPDALHLLLGTSLPSDLTTQLKYLLYWAPVDPVTAVTYFLPEYRNHPFIIQYAMRALESHSVDVTFFYVPQIVQTLRYDVLGYVQRYIIDTAKFSQLFAHQIIWNMTANVYKDEESGIEDSLKPTLDIVKERMITSFSGEDKAFYEREFSFFSEITGISGKLRPFIKKSKPEKKQKIEEELRLIKVEPGVYLPSNPDGTVIGIDRKSGKPLQSHAKAPFIATFRIRKNRGAMDATDEMTLNNTNGEMEEDASREKVLHENTYEVWQSAIFKVGDDCRQDVLALQMIAAFRGIFNNVGLDVYVYPYRVTATAPGCGVIDVLPNSISRDMLGREAVNGLYDYFISKYGAETSIPFQEARNNFVKSMAAYSVISYLLQFKDRHNGNIMIDDAGHILHIDFGFCFDIAPGGVRFERAPFKLTTEMVAVMGGSTTSQSYKWFEELCIKAFLASRPYAEQLCHIVTLMLGSGLPCFKPETIAHLKQRFVLEKSEREAADFMRDLIRKSYSSYSTKGYDQFQLLTNGIPY